MNLNITIGKYYPREALLHRLDPRVKLFANFAFLTLLFVGNNIYSYILSAIAIILLISASKVPFSFVFAGIKSILFLISFTAILNLFFTRGETMLFEFAFIRISLEGIINAIKMVSRIFMILISSSLLTLTTSPLALTDGIEYSLKPLKRFGVPSHEIAMMMSIALRFIPTLIEEVDKISKAQMARGADFTGGSIKDRAKAMLPLLVPLFISAFTRADELAMAMEARCYRGDINRTRMRVLQYTSLDYWGMFFILIYSVVIISILFIIN